MKANEVIRELAEALAEARQARALLKKFNKDFAQENRTLEDKVQWADFDRQHLEAMRERKNREHLEEVSALHDTYSKVCGATVLLLQRYWLPGIDDTSFITDVVDALRTVGYEPFPKVLEAEVMSDGGQ